MPYPEATTHTDTGKLVWDSDGYYSFGSDTWKDISVTVKMIYQGGEMGLIPRFDSPITYVAFIMGNKDSIAGPDGAGSSTAIATASLLAQISGDQIYLGDKTLSTLLVVGQEYTIKAEIKRTNYRIFLDNTMIFNVEYGGLNNGSAALYGMVGTEATEIEVQDVFPDAWTTNVETISGAIVCIKELANKDKYLYMYNSQDGQELYSQQTIGVSGGAHTLSVKTKGAVSVEIIELDGVGPAIYTVSFPDDDWTEQEYTFIVNNDCTQVTLRFSLDTVGECSINNVQLEAKNHKTSYIHNDRLDGSVSRSDSWVTYPAKNNITGDMGGLSVWVKPLVNYNNELGLTLVIFEYGVASGDQIKLYHEGEEVKFTYGDAMLTFPIVLEADTWYHLAVSWSEYGLRLFVDGAMTEANSIYTFEGGADIIRIGHSESGDVFNGFIDDLIIFSKSIDSDKINEILYSSEPIPNRQDMSLRATFNYAIGNFNQSVIEMSPAPLYGSPVIARKADGTIMEKVSFYDKTTGEFKTYNTEKHIYDGRSDYLRVGYKEVDMTSFQISVRDKDGALVGDPYTVSNNRIYLTLTSEEKKDLRGTALYVTYQPENPYTVDFNIGQPDSFRVTLGKHDGQAVTVDYEGNRYSDEKLATMIELNPMLNPNHEGFMYIVQSSNMVSMFRGKSSPTDLPADGVSESVVTIEPLDNNGNFISHAKLRVTAKYGSIVPNYDEGSIRLRETAGRYLYRYRAPLRYFADEQVPEIIDSIDVLDTVTGLGIQIPVALAILDDYFTSDMAKTVEEANWETIGARLLSIIMEHFEKDVSSLPSGLGDVLDFNGDGVINLQEIIWLNQYKFTQDLYNKYIDVLTWYEQNE